MTVHADIHVAAVAAFDPEPVDEGRVGLAAEPPQHGAPGRQGQPAAPLQAAGRGFDADPRGAVEFRRLLVELRHQLADQPAKRGLDPGQRRLQRLGQRQQFGRRLQGGGFQAVG